MKKYIIWIAVLFFAVSLQAQKIVTEPVLPVTNQPFTIYYHSDQDAGSLKNYTGALYAHTGVTVGGKLWQNVIGTWGVNTSQPQLEYLGSYTYKLSITPDVFGFYSVATGSDITQVSLVIRSADGTKQTSPDIFIDIYSEGLNINFTQPQENNLIVEHDDIVPVNATATLSDSIALYLNGEFVAGTISSQSIDYNFTASQYGANRMIAKAFKLPDVVSDTLDFFVRPIQDTLELPLGCKDGINYLSDTSAVLCLYAPHKNYVFALGEFDSWTADTSNYMKKTPDGLRYWIQLNGLIPGKEYAYQYFIDGKIKVGDPYCDKVLDSSNDPWISSATYPGLRAYPKGQTSGIVSVLQTAQPAYVWKHTDYSPPVKENAVIYELLLRDFLANHDWKTLTDTLDYFSKLGVTAIEVMPFSEFEGNESWGYNPNYYFAPDKYYGPKNDLKAFVDSCHSRGIAVIQDMVLNHAYGSCPLVMMYWNSALNRPAADNPWFNVTSPNPIYSWGSDFNHESQDTKDFVDRVTSYWMTEYQVDGFRFDFTKGFTNTPGEGGAYDASRIAILKRMADKIWEVNPNAYVILEHFTDNSEEKILADYGMMIWGNMNYNYNEATMGYNDSGKSDLTYISYKNKGWSSPNLMGYMESHDEERLMFKNLTYGNSSGVYDIKQLPTALRRVEMAAAFFITVPGPKMIWQFGEMGYDISINYNNDRVGKKPLHWEYLETRPRLNPLFASLIHLKTTEPAFSTTDFNLSVVGAAKRVELNHADMDVRIIGNFDVVNLTIDPNFSKTGNWYDYFSGETLSVTDVHAAISLEPGEYHIYTTKQLSTPNLPNAIRRNDLVNPEIEVYPNPVQNMVQIKGKTSISQLWVKDMEGRTLKTIYPDSESVSLDLSDYKPGVYLLITREKAGQSIKKLIKE
ncbi:MAG: T9SS type A sorting domain-containing protein [Bacteroidales bacterium]|nr:T9SS type A sorting domain-containing protein [Bacteroidales bacterium]MCB9013683.1 T9SS type A sorting domain-containing protein [Bacteroidales bacterium]